jgi:hypothetical protein
MSQITLRQHNGFATLLVPPKDISCAAQHNQGSDSEFVPSGRSRNSITYQRPFRFQINPSLTDIRSWRNSLSSDEESFTSSVTPGIGYLSGTAIKWVGEKILDLAITPLAVRRRIWVINRMINRMEKEPIDKFEKRILRKETSLHRLVDDLLELSSFVLSFTVQRNMLR